MNGFVRKQEQVNRNNYVLMHSEEALHVMSETVF